MKKFSIVLSLLFISISFAQETKHLNLEDAVMGRSKGLYPAQKAVRWMDDSDQYFFTEENTLYKSSASAANENSKTSIIGLKDLQVTFTDLKRMPNFMNVSSEIVTFRHDYSIVRYNYTDNAVSDRIKYPESAENTHYNEAARAIAYTIDNNLFIATTATERISVTQNSDQNIVSGQAIARSEFGIRNGIFWSPKGSLLAFYQKDESKVTDYPLVDVTTTPASLNNIKYPMNGMDSEIAKVGVYNLKANTVIYLDIDTSDEHYLTNLSWSPDEKHVLLAELNRDQNHMWFTIYDATNGKKVKTLFEEKNDAWVEPEHTARFIPNSTTEFIWLSERDGFMNLYVYDLNNGSVKQLTNYNWVVNSILGFDEENKHIIISGTGDDPRESKAFKVSLKNGKTTSLTKEAGSHRVSLSPKGTYFIDSYSSMEVPRMVKLKSLDLKSEVTLFTADNPLKDHQLGTTELLTLESDNGVTLYGRIIKPANFDASKKYPVLIYVYGGPHAQLVRNSWMGGSNLWMQWMAAEQDYVVFTLDNQGSASRGFAFESIIHRQIGEQEMKDQIKGVDYLKSLSYVDKNRLAVHGWSYGGFMTNSLMLRHPGIFTTAVAGGPVTDWKWYEIMYGERYMDRWQENEEGFDTSRVHNYVANLEGKLLEVIGSVDPVVVPQHTMTLLDAFIKNKKQVDFLSYPMHPHNVRGIDRAHLMKKVLDYVIENNK